MDITSIDQNLKVETTIDRPGLVWLDATLAPLHIHGLCEPRSGEQMHRMPPDIAEAVSPGVKTLNYCTAGGRIRFATDSPYIAIHLTRGMPFDMMAHFPLTGSHAPDLYVDRKDADGKVHSDFVKTFLPPVDAGVAAYDSVIDIGEHGMQFYTINLPLYAGFTELSLGLRAGSQVESGYAYENDLPVVYYGSSITQGGCASHAGNAYPAIISQKYNIDYLNLGFSGSCKAEPEMIDYLASLKMSVFVCDYDHNAPTLDHLKKTLPQLLTAVRRAHPGLPILVASSPRLTPFETPQQNGRRLFIRDLCRDLRAAGDLNIHHVDGALLFGTDCPLSCTMDGTHPNDLGFYRMAEVFGNLLMANMQ